MKRIFNLIACATAIFAFTACEDVPAPYQPNTDLEDNGGATTFVSSTGLSDFTVKTIEGVAWSPGSSYAKATGYNSTDKTYTPSKSYIISPKFDLTGVEAAYITYDYALQYTSGISNLEQKHRCLVSTDYAGDPTTATWIGITIPLNTTGKDGSTWLFENTGKIALPEAVLGQQGVVLAFYFECDGKSSTTWELKNVKVAAGSADEAGEGSGDAVSSKANPFTVAEAKNHQSGSGWVKAYIVGYIPGKALSEAVFGTNEAVATNIVIADSPNETDVNNCMPVQLVSGSPVRAMLNLIDNPANLGKEVLIYGSLETYFNAPGLKSPSYTEIDGKSAGTEPGNEPVVSGEEKPITMAELLAAMTSDGAVIDAVDNRTFEAVVQANVAGANYSRNNLPVAIEGANAASNGVLLYGSQVDPSTLGLTQGDKVKVTLYAGKATAKDYSGCYEITGGQNDTWCKVEKIGTANITPIVLNASELANLINYQSMTVTVNNASTTAGTWSGTHTFTADGVDFTVYHNNNVSYVNSSIDETKTGTITGVVTVYKGAAQIAPRTSEDVKDFLSDDVPSTPDTPDVPSIDGLSMTSAAIASSATGSVTLATNGYGAMNVTDESTWYTWSIDGVNFTGCRICIAPAANGGGLQVQGYDNDVTKQGFLGNVTPFSSIKTIQLTARVVSTNTYAPAFHLYAGNSQLPNSNAIEAEPEMTESNGFRTYVYTYDLSAGNYTHFAVRNDSKGVLYIDSIVIATK